MKSLIKKYLTKLAQSFLLCSILNFTSYAAPETVSVSGDNGYSGIADFLSSAEIEGSTYNLYSLNGAGATYENVLPILKDNPWFEGSADYAWDLLTQPYTDSLGYKIISSLTPVQQNDSLIVVAEETNFIDQEDSINFRFYRIFSNGYGNSAGSQVAYWDTEIINERNYWLLGFLQLGPSADDTLASMQPNASATKNAFNSQYATLAYGLNHDCTVFDSKGICMSLFGRNTSVNDSAFDSNAAGVVIAYKPHSQFRVGTYVDQSLNSNTMAGVNVERSNPDFGVFGVWNKNTNGQGLAIRAAANYGSRDFNVSRTAIGTAEAGVGKTDLDAYGALLEASYAYPINDAWTAKPYAALRYLSIQRDGYTETTAIDNPLSYSGLEQQTTSALVGLRFTGYLTPKVTTAVNVGVEHDLHHGIDNYRATGVDSLGFVNMDNQTDRTRPTAGARLSYAVAEQQFISAAVQYRKEIFMSESSVTGQVNYTIGF